MSDLSHIHRLKSFQLHNPNSLHNPKSLAYSHVAEVRHFLRILHISGQSGENAQGILAQNFALQAEQAFQNILFALEDCDATLHDIAVLRIFVVDHNSQKHQQLITIMQQLWQHHDFPACTLIPVPALALPGMQIEVEATAYSL
ncbi:RidA family protein [Acinetobacter larvae]|uniref:YjgF family translation initiation inhibitor n=1 Tax=Acinetobacter larvae TaxID=1789224 RepID=A0A1B2M1X9_9GAMM|nr:RidA family protein [Acinetobacter larvae]AOA59192.1 YjgF family translation initiation inhibitor [Acinetobacter larvae]